MVKNPLANAGTQVELLDEEDPLEEEMANHSSILAWRIPWREEIGRVRKESATTEQLSMHACNQCQTTAWQLDLM